MGIRITSVLAFFIGCIFSATGQSFNFEWASGFYGSGSGSNCQSNSVTTDVNGNVYTTGSFDWTTDFSSGQGTTVLTSNAPNDVFVCKQDASGNALWARHFGGNIGLYNKGEDVIVDSNNDIIVTGSFSGTVDFDPGPNTFDLTAVGIMDIFILKLTSNGDFLWAVRMGGSAAGGNEEGHELALDAAGNIYTTGVYASSDADFDPSAGVFTPSWQGGVDIFIQKLDANGNFLWMKSFGGNLIDWSRSIKTDNLGNIYIGGEFMSTVNFDPNGSVAQDLTASGAGDGFVLKLDANGDFIWVDQFTCSSDLYELYLEVDGSNAVFISGYFEGNLDMDPGTNVVNFNSGGNFEGFIGKLDANGDYLWAHQVGGVAGDASTGIALDNLGNVYNLGAFFNTIDFDPGVDTFNLTASNSLDIYVQKLNTNGDFLWAYQLGGNGLDYGYDIHVDAANNVYSTGKSQGSADFDPSSAVHTLVGPGEFGHVEKISQGACSSTFATDVQTICDSLTWIDGITYTSSNTTATHTLANAAGCDSVVTLNLTITNSTTGIDTQTACNSFTWIDGNTYTSSNNSATYTLANAVGCDSIVTLDLTINTVNTTTSTTDVTIAADASGAMYQWIDCDNNNAPISGETGQSFTATVNGNYAVIVTENGCSDTSACVAITTIGLDALDLDWNYTMFPNPTNENITIAFSNSIENVTVQVRDAQGRLMLQNSYASTTEIELKLGASPGIYLVSLLRDDQIVTERIVKQ